MIPAGGRLFRGWIVVAAVHAVLFVAFGVSYSFAAFFSAFQAEFGAARGDVSLVFAISGFLYFMVGAVAGNVADRFGPRRVVLAGVALLAAGLAIASRAPTLAALYVTYSVGVGLGVGCLYVPAVGAVQPWFIRRRGVASGVAVAGIGLGTLVVPLLATWLVGTVGWRGAFEVFAAGVLVVGGVAAALVDNDPRRHGLAPDGDPALAGMPPKQAPRGILLTEAATKRAFWLKYGAILCCSLGLFIPFVHLTPYARDHGLPEEIGVLLMGLIGVGSLVGRFGLAGLGDRMPRTSLHGVLYLGMAAMLALWLGSSSVLPLALFAIVFGAFYGAFVALQPALAMDFYGARNVAGIIGALYTAAGIGNLIGPWLAGVAYDVSGSYTVPIVASIACMLVAAVLAWILRREPSYAG